ncbi:peptidase domain-containing ABC transporter [Roseicella aquatilis]|uniref:Peptidase domain-containing ABC transporter n=1 Tax=Roseicella aquatilis TaxID=2527868 RepID=A0A4R4D627_9PROT|nr:peptidase domain-containing ABC transporter [Roseicella aquatilis]TCZ54220.1 peptidase domain-containing ABC transporter [Roseicella aquatilis]
MTDEMTDAARRARRLAAVAQAARQHGVEMDTATGLRCAPEAVPSTAALADWARGQGLWARGVRLSFRQLARARREAPIVLLLADGGAALAVAADPARGLAWLRDPEAPGEEPVAVDELRLSHAWTGEALLLRRAREAPAEEQPFDLGWVMRLVLGERRMLRDIALASLALSLLAVVPALLTSTILDRVIARHAWSTLELVAALLVITVGIEALLGHARRELLQVLSTRVDAKLNLHVFDRLLALPLGYFERHPAGEVNHQVAQIFKVRAFLTGRLMTTALDAATLLVLLPLLLLLQPLLTGVVVLCAGLIALATAAFLPAMRRAQGRVIQAEMAKHALMVETVHGIRAIKSLALEGTRREAWDARVAAAGHAQLAAGRLGSWPVTVTLPLERFIDRGVLALAAGLVLAGSAEIQVGALVAFTMLSGRLAAPLLGLARLTGDLEEARMAVRHVAEVLNNPTETQAMQGGLRPAIQGEIAFEAVTFTYPGARRPALDGISFRVPAGAMLGLVGRSGSGKSTVTRLLQGIDREYAGAVRIDGTDAKEINLGHLRRNLGIVLQDNILLRGTVRDNILAGRPGLTAEDAARAARLAGAEEFIERLPRGFETLIEEGSANLSGGQRQRLAIARAIAGEPRVLILDEATSALDPESEAVVNANLARLAEGRTMVIVSHRLSSLVGCDLIAVLDQGRLVDIAPHALLLERCEIYRQLWMQQNRHIMQEAGSRTLAAE